MVGALSGLGIASFVTAGVARADFEDLLVDLFNLADLGALASPAEVDGLSGDAVAGALASSTSLSSPADQLASALNQLLVTLLGDPGACGLVCNGADGTSALNPDGQGGGVLFGNGGNGWTSTDPGVAGGNGGQAGLFGNGGMGGGGDDAHGGAGGNADLLGNGGDGGAGTGGHIGGLAGTAGSLFGEPGTNGTGTTPADAVPMETVNTRAIVDVSVSGGREIPVIVDTGSRGLLIPISDLGTKDIGFPTGIGFARAGGLEEIFVYLKIPAAVDFGNGVSTEQTTVDAVLFSFPRSFTSGLVPADGVLGVGPGADAPGTEPVTDALPGDLSQGVLVNQPDGYLQFGADQLPAVNTVAGSPFADLGIQFGKGSIEPVSGVIDSGGVTGILPSSIAGSDVNIVGNLLGGFGLVTPGTQITVYDDVNGIYTELYSYTAEGYNDPIIVPDGLLRIIGGGPSTGNTPFSLGPIYISDTPTDTGQTIFDYRPAVSGDSP